MNTMQQEFDAVVQHLYKQCRPASEDGTCKYRTADGLMCAVGCRIPDEMYVPEMDTNLSGVGIGIILYKFPLPAEIFAYQDMFSHLQRIHDNWSGVYGWVEIEDELRACAEKFSLTFNIPTGPTPQEPK
jgi:hypothetical protein